MNLIDATYYEEYGTKLTYAEWFILEDLIEKGRIMRLSTHRTHMIIYGCCGFIMGVVVHMVW